MLRAAKRSTCRRPCRIFFASTQRSKSFDCPDFMSDALSRHPGGDVVVPSRTLFLDSKLRHNRVHRDRDLASEVWLISLRHEKWILSGLCADFPCQGLGYNLQLDSSTPCDLRLMDEMMELCDELAPWSFQCNGHEAALGGIAGIPEVETKIEVWEHDRTASCVPGQISWNMIRRLASAYGFSKRFDIYHLSTKTSDHLDWKSSVHWMQRLKDLIQLGHIQTSVQPGIWTPLLILSLLYFEDDFQMAWGTELMLKALLIYTTVFRLSELAILHLLEPFYAKIRGFSGWTLASQKNYIYIFPQQQNLLWGL